MILRITKAHKDLSYALDTIDKLESGKKAARQWFISEMMNYQIGIGETRDMMEGLVAFFESRLNYLRAVYNARVALADLEQAIGKPLIDESP